MAFEFNNMQTDLVMLINFLYLIMAERGFRLACKSKPLHGNCQKLVFLRFLHTWFMFVSAFCVDRLGNRKDTQGEILQVFPSLEIKSVNWIIIYSLLLNIESHRLHALIISENFIEKLQRVDYP
jgi:hypothetical protein